MHGLGAPRSRHVSRPAGCGVEVGAAAEVLQVGVGVGFWQMRCKVSGRQGSSECQDRGPLPTKHCWVVRVRWACEHKRERACVCVPGGAWRHSPLASPCPPLQGHSSGWWSRPGAQFMVVGVRGGGQFRVVVTVRGTVYGRGGRGGPQFRVVVTAGRIKRGTTGVCAGLVGAPWWGWQRAAIELPACSDQCVRAQCV